jgi:hypothetical protein
LETKPRNNFFIKKIFLNEKDKIKFKKDKKGNRKGNTIK